MLIGELATRANVNIETIRYYERRGLLPKADRLASGYRSYRPDDVRRVSFIRHAQSLGFTLHEVEDLLTLWNDAAESCEAVQERARAARDRIDARIHDLTRMRRALDHYVGACQRHGALQACPLLQELGAGAPPREQPRAQRTTRRQPL